MQLAHPGLLPYPHHRGHDISDIDVLFIHRFGVVTANRAPHLAVLLYALRQYPGADFNVVTSIVEIGFFNALLPQHFF